MLLVARGPRLCRASRDFRDGVLFRPRPVNKARIVNVSYMVSDRKECVFDRGEKWVNLESSPEIGRALDLA